MYYCVDNYSELDYLGFFPSLISTDERSSGGGGGGGVGGGLFLPSLITGLSSNG